MSEWAKHYAGLNITASDDNGKLRPISRVSLFLDDQNYLTAGDDTGYELTATCPHATQAMVNALLAKFRGYQYQMMSADDTAINQASELGDGVTAGGVYFGIARINDDGSGYLSVTAPGEQEQEDEYPMDGPIVRMLTQSTNRKITETRSLITKTAEEITAKVEEVNGKYTELKVTIDGVTVKGPGGTTYLDGGSINTGSITADKMDIKDLSALKATIGGFTIGYSAIYNGLSSLSGSSNGVYLGTDGIALGGGKFKVDSYGNLTAENASISGTVNATSGTFSSVTITGSDFSGKLNNATGSISEVSGSYKGSINSSGTFTGTHKGGYLRTTELTDYCTGWLNTSGGNDCGVYLGSVQSCNTLGTSLKIGDAGNIGVNGNFPRLYGEASSLYGGTSYLIQGPSGATESGNIVVNGNLTCRGTKPRTMDTAHFGSRQLDAYETPLPTFSDYGTAALDETGVFHIIIDPIFAETVDTLYLPTVFLTKYGEGDIWVERVTHEIVIVRGTPGLKFAWETRYAQANAGVERLRVTDFDYQDLSGEHAFDDESGVAYEHDINNVDYARAGYEYLSSFERSIEP